MLLDTVRKLCHCVPPADTKAAKQRDGYSQLRCLVPSATSRSANRSDGRSLPQKKPGDKHHGRRRAAKWDGGTDKQLGVTRFDTRRGKRLPGPIAVVVAIPAT